MRKSLLWMCPAKTWDISIEADILEEIARIYGYDNIPTTLPTTPSQPGRLTQKQQLIRKTRTVAEGLGLNQAITYVLTSKEHASLLKSDDHSLVELELPMVKSSGSKTKYVPRL